MAILGAFSRDLRQAVRSLRRDVGFTTTVLLTLALCLGANVVIFTVVRSVLLRPLPFADADRLVVVYNRYPKAGVEHAGASIPNYYDRRGAIAAFTDIAIVRRNEVTVGDGGSPERLVSWQASPSFFRVLGVQPELGRFYTEEENEYGHSDVVVLSDAFWRSRFHADPGVIGTSMRINDIPTTVIGVLPPDFQYLSSTARMWQPLPSSKEDRLPGNRHANNQNMIARLQPGATIAQAQAQIDALNARLIKDDPFAKLVLEAGFDTKVADLHADHVASVRPTLLLLQAGVLFLLLIGGVNLANLLLIRASARSRELAIRQALGASRGQVAAQVVAETLVLTLAGALLGLGVGAAAVRGLSLLGTDHLPLGASIAFDGPVAVTALAGAIVFGLLLALPVVWFNAHGSLAPVLNTESRGGTTTRATHRLRHALIVAQIGLAFTLLAGAGLLGLSFQRVLAVQPGFQPEHLLTGQVPLPWKNYKEDAPRLSFANRLLAELRALPGVKAAGLCTTLPFSGDVSDNAIVVEGYTPAPGDSVQAHYTYLVLGDYFAALGIPLHEGRLLTAADSLDKGTVCVVDEDFARRYWRGASAVGHALWDGPREAPDAHRFTIVGVVGSVKQADLSDQRATGAVYFPFATNAAPSGQWVVVRTVQAPEAAGPELRRAVQRIDPELPLADLKPMTLRIDGSLVTRRSPLLLVAIFAGAALVLAAVGIYGVLAYAVAQRRREIGVRMALGAVPAQIRRQFLFLGVRLLLVGTGLGIAGAWLVGRAMHSLLFGVAPANPWVLGGTALLLGAVVLLACLLPSRRAAHTDPLSALRAE
ncbi:MAG TPA: ABC transporter permease [Opitutaceae bacterium]|nr:ABC transporter permease [Opitutaceae bacterium]